MCIPDYFRYSFWEAFLFYQSFLSSSTMMNLYFRYDLLNGLNNTNDLGEKILANHISDKRLISGIYGELLKFNNIQFKNEQRT